MKNPGVMLIDGIYRSVAVVTCCQDWTILVGTKISKCGICGQVPS